MCSFSDLEGRKIFFVWPVTVKYRKNEKYKRERVYILRFSLRNVSIPGVAVFWHPSIVHCSSDD